MAIFVLTTVVDKKVSLQCIPCFQYLVQFQKDKYDDVQDLVNLKSEINVMTPIYISKLGLAIRQTNVRAYKIDKSLLKIYKIVIAGFRF